MIYLPLFKSKHALGTKCPEGEARKPETKDQMVFNLLASDFNLYQRLFSMCMQGSEGVAMALVPVAVFSAAFDLDRDSLGNIRLNLKEE